MIFTRPPPSPKKMSKPYESSEASVIRKKLHEKAYSEAYMATARGDLARAVWYYGILKDLDREGEGK